VDTHFAFISNDKINYFDSFAISTCEHQKPANPIHSTSRYSLAHAQKTRDEGYMLDVDIASDPVDFVEVLRGWDRLGLL
jgi:hypothetical protein